MLTRTCSIYLRKTTRKQTILQPKDNFPEGRHRLKRRGEKTQQNLKRLIKLGRCSQALLAQQLLFAVCTLFTHEFQRWLVVRCVLILPRPFKNHSQSSKQMCFFYIVYFSFFIVAIPKKFIKMETFDRVKLVSLLCCTDPEVCISAVTSLCFMYRVTDTFRIGSVALPARCPTQPNAQMLREVASH